MSSHTAPTPFPCPFCQSTRVALLGGGLVFHHYKCGECAEVWTAMAASRPPILRPSEPDPPAAEPETARGRRREKLWLH